MVSWNDAELVTVEGWGRMNRPLAEIVRGYQEEKAARRALAPVIVDGKIICPTCHELIGDEYACCTNPRCPTGRENIDSIMADEAYHARADQEAQDYFERMEAL